MGNILYGIKRFFKNKNTVTILALLASLFILYWAYNYRIDFTTRPISVPYATRQIGPKSEITSDMVSTKKVPGGVVSNEVLTTTRQIVGRYVSNNAVVPMNSVFYSSVVKTWDDLPRSSYGDIPDGNTIVALPVTLDTTYGNSIFPGNYIDLYFYTTDSTSGKLMVGKFIESINVLSVTNSNGNNIFESIGNLDTPAYLIFSVPEDIHLLLRKATYFGNIFPVPRNAKYSSDPKPTSIASTYIQQYILSKTIMVEDRDRINGTQISGANIIGRDVAPATQTTATPAVPTPTTTENATAQ